MRTTILLLAASLFTLFAWGQGIAIGTIKPHPSAALDVSSNSKGFLAPRMTLKQRDAIKLPAIGLVVFVTNDSSYYFFNGKWKKLALLDRVWNLKGNIGTNDSTDFVGTTDSARLNFRVNNTFAGTIDLLNKNTFLGYQAGEFTILGDPGNPHPNPPYNFSTIRTANTAIGQRALSRNTTGFGNVAIGDGALENNYFGYSNVAIGSGALNRSIDHHNIVAIGDSALFNQSFTYIDNGYNTAVGSKTLYTNSYGRMNTALGYQALYSNRFGNGNTAVGIHALYSNTTASDYYLTSGNNNTANGVSALYSNTIGWGNTAVGSASLSENTTGFTNTAIGAFSNVSDSNLMNSTAIGSGAIVTASNKVMIGNNNPAMVIGGFADWSNFSDGRFKENINENVPGLEFIKKLRPITYTVNTQKLDDYQMQKMTDTTRLQIMQSISQSAKSENPIHTGFIAQEVEKVANELQFNFDGINKPGNETDTYSLSYGQFVVPLVKAMQEQQKIIEDQNKKIDSLQAQIDELKRLLPAVKQN